NPLTMEKYMAIMFLFFYAQLPLWTSPMMQTNQTDRLALIYFKHSVDEDPLGALSSWNDSFHHCEWQGVICGGRHPERVVSLNLMSKGLGGLLSPHVGNLSFLRSLVLQNNSFRGEIPQSIGHLFHLRHLILSNNSFGGQMPANLSWCSNLEILNLIDNQLVGKIPDELGSLSKLQALGLAINSLAGYIPHSIGNLSQLYKLSLMKNGLQGEIPKTLSKLHGLTFVQLAYNQLIGEIPSAIFNMLKALRVISLTSNELRDDFSFITSLTNCSRLEVISLDLNFLEGLLPDSIGNLSNSVWLISMPSNTMYETIPPGIGNLFNLSYLDLSNNLLGGRVPSCVGALHNLQDLYLSGNMLTGEIPSSIGNLTLLSRFYLSFNDFYGEIPQSLGNCRQLIELELSNNNLSGSIPGEVLGLSTISIIFSLAHNQLSGALPSQVGSLINLGELDLSYNKLMGPIPSSINKCLVLERLSLAVNSFHGKIPLALGTLRGLQELDVSHNNLSGEIPSFLAQLTDLKYLNLSSNKLEGEVPKQGVFLNASAVFIFENRNLCGGIAELNLPSCKSNKVKVIAIAIVVLSFFIWWSYGTIYKATTQEGGLVAVKVLNLGHRGASKSFVSECRTLGAIRHRNLMKIVNICSSVDYHGNDFKALLYEYMANGNLENWIHQGNEEDVDHEHEHGKPGHLGLMQRLDIAIDIASAIEYLHKVCSPKIVHGDLKPSNVLLDNKMMGRVGDFGLATISSPSKTNAMDIHDGKYGMGDMVSTQGDMYSYGILLLEMLTGRRPTEETFKDHLNLHNFVKVALPDQMMEIVDLAIFNGESENDIERMRGCVASILRIGVACSMELPQDRMDVAEALKELHKVRARYGSK
ncbi:hypothetical protein EUGRSUZ_C01543, partial [Eucalyptus grandis]